MVLFVFRPKTEHNERFARQYRHEHPPEFPLTLPFSGSIFQVPTVKITVGRRCTCPSIHFHCACSAHKHAKTHRRTDTQTYDTDTMCVAFALTFTYTYRCSCRLHSFCSFLTIETQSGTRRFHDVYCSKPLTFHNG